MNAAAEGYGRHIRLSIIGRARRLKLSKLSAVSPVVTTQEERKLPCAFVYAPDSKNGPVFMLSVPTAEAAGFVRIKATIVYSGRTYELVAMFRETGPGHWTTESTSIVDADAQPS